VVGLGHLSPAGTNGSETAYGVSADGSVVVGEAPGAQGPEAFRWTQATGMVGLGDLPGGVFHSSAQAVSSDGRVIVGFSASAAGNTEAFRWTEGTGIVGLGDLPGGVFYSRAEATSADGGVVVGMAATDPGGATAFIWTPADGMRSLQEVLTTAHGLGSELYGFTLSDARDVSDDGRVIVGHGRNASGETEGFVVVIPEPAAASVGFGAMLVALLAGRRGR
jgi:probable HAF family extracellular repeat protein